MVEIERLESESDIREVRKLIELHEQYTGSTVAKALLADWEHVVDSSMVKIMPKDYKRVLEERMKHEEELDTGVHGVFTNG